jgi:diguanylate cyclase (GGDEF)-like protein/PAS domain S-box-containing protein
MTKLAALTAYRPRVWLAGTLVLLGINLTVPWESVSGLVYMGVLFGAGWLAWAAVARARGAQRHYAVLVATGVTAAFAASVSYLVVWVVAGTMPIFSLADVLWFVAQVCFVCAVLVMLRETPGARRWDIEALIDAAVVTVVGTLVVTELVVETTVHDATLPLLARVCWGSSPILDVIMLMLVIRVCHLVSARTGWLVAGGALCWLAADLAFLTDGTAGSVDNVMAVGWLLGPVLFTMAAARGRATEQRLRPLRPGTANEIGMVRITLALLPVLLPALDELHVINTDTGINPVLVLAATLLLMGLTVVRMARLVRANRRARLLLLSRERRSSVLAENASDAIVVVDAQRNLKEDAPGLATLIGYPGYDISGYDLLTMVAGEHVAEAEAVFERCVATPGRVFELELRVNHRGGRRVWFSARLRSLLHDPDVAAVVVNLHDITDRKRAEEELSHQAFHDTLTGLANRALFRDRLDHALDSNARTGAHPAVIFLDLDGFKTVNDSLGHDAGDELLREVAVRLAAAVRRGDTVGRLGGDEFAILVEQSLKPLDQAATVADRVLQILTEPVVLAGGHRVVLSASLGIAVGGDDCDSASLLRDADVAMYQAKSAGKSRWVLFDPGMRTAAVQRLELETDLRYALDRNEFRLHYQPVVELETERIVGFEALLRWQHPTQGLVPPDWFIPLAEENGMIVPIGRWVLQEATRTAARWRRLFDTGQPLSMAVNVSARQLAVPQLVDDVADALASSGLDPSALVLEMTETVLVHDASTAAQRLHELRRLGVRLAIDDFGTGYSSLSYLRQFPVDILKIDRSFINTITERSQVPAIVRGLLDLGRTLQLETVAEGVELPFQSNQLREEHCDLAQGYLFARPMPAQEAELLLSGLALKAAG